MAFEAARQLLQKGFDVKGLVLIDAPLPINHQPLPKTIITKVLEAASTNKRQSLSKDVVNQFGHHAALLGAYRPSDTEIDQHQTFKTVMLRSQDTLDTEKLYGVRYEWLSSQSCRDEAIKGWKELVGGHFETLPIPGSHFEVFDPNNVRMRIPFCLWCKYLN